MSKILGHCRRRQFWGLLFLLSSLTEGMRRYGSSVLYGLARLLNESVQAEEEEKTTNAPGAALEGSLVSVCPRFFLFYTVVSALGLPRSKNCPLHAMNDELFFSNIVLVERLDTAKRRHPPRWIVEQTCRGTTEKVENVLR